jgi:hypothetical protein
MPKFLMDRWHVMPFFKILILALCLQLIPLGVKAQELEATFSRLCTEVGVSKELAMTIAKAESRMNPLAINVAGQGYFPKDEAEARAIIKKAHAAGYSYDVGLMQINRFWIERWSIAPESLLDPETNIRVGLRVLSGEISRYGFTWKAVGAYHSPTPSKSTGYAWRIYEQAKPGAIPQTNVRMPSMPRGKNGDSKKNLITHNPPPMSGVCRAWAEF